MQYLKIKNWDKWQTYRKDRGTPPWIKIHLVIMSNPEWASLTDAEKGQIVSIWLVAADKQGMIPNDSIILKKICQLDDAPNINKFIELGFIDGKRLSSGCQVAVNQTSNGCPHDAPETETETETETEKDICIISGENDTPAKKSNTTDPEFEKCWSLYPKRESNPSKRNAEKTWKARRKEGVTVGQLLTATKNYASYVRAKGDEGTNFVKMASTFFGPGEHWKEFQEPVKLAKTNNQQAPRKTAAEKRIDDFNDAWTEAEKMMGIKNTGNGKSIINGEVVYEH